MASGFPQQNISLVTASLKNETAAVKKALELGDESEKDAVIGAGIGGVVGLLGGATVVTMAGMGVVIAGPLGAMTGVVVGGLIGAIQRLERPQRSHSEVRSQNKIRQSAGAGPRQ